MLERLGVVAIGLLLTGSARAAQPCSAGPYECAMVLLGRHETPAAVAILRESLKAQPNDLRARNLLGIALLESGETQKAAAAFSQALAANPMFYPARKNLAVAQFTLGQFDQAKRNFEKVHTQQTNDPISHLYLGELAFRTAHCASPAVEHFANAGSTVSSVPAFAVHYAECLIQAKHIEDAVVILKHLPAEVADAQFAAGLLLAKTGLYAEAAPFFHQARQGFSDSYAATYNEVYSYLQAGEYQVAVNAVDSAFREGSAKGELLNLQASAYRKLNRVQDAYGALQKAAKLSPNEESNYVDLANLCLDYDNFQLGLEILNIGLKNIPDSERLHLHRGVMRAMTGEFPEAEADFQFAASMSPDSALPRVALSLIWMQNGDMPKAVESLRRLDKNNDTHFATAFVLGQALTRQGPELGSDEDKEALAAFEKAVRLDPQYAAARAELGKALLRRGEETRGVAELEKALSLDPQDRTAAYQLAQVYRRKGQQQRAIELMSRVRDLNERDRDQDLRRSMIKIVRAAAGTAQAPNAGFRPDFVR